MHLILYKYKIYVNMMMISIVKLISRIIPDFQVLFFPSGFSFMNIHQSRDSRGREKYFFNSSLPFHRRIIWEITGESSCLRKAGRRTQTGNLWFPSASHLRYNFPVFCPSNLFFLYLWEHNLQKASEDLTVF